MTSRAVWFWTALALVLAASRFAHLHILWSDEDYHLASAIQILHGKALYRDLWYDKPPGAALLALLFGGYAGWPLRVVGSLLALASSALAYRFAASLWSPREGYVAAALLAFAQIFYLTQGVLPLEPDTWMILPHVAAVYLAWRGRPLASGLAAGLAFLLTPKGGFVLLAALVFQPQGWLPMLMGFAIPNVVFFAWLVSAGALGDYWEQVWRWGFAYTGSSPDASPTAPLLRLGTWAGFHAALIVAAFKPREPRRQLILWIAIAFAAACVGWRLPPRYLNQLLVPMVIAAAGTWSLWLRSRAGIAALTVLLLIPTIRFGPRYFRLDSWDDTALDRESRAAGRLIDSIAQPGDTLFIWGYRPNIAVYTRLPVASRLWESQPLTGVPADRHLRESQPVEAAAARTRRIELTRTDPTIVADGLSLYNPALDIHNYPELRDWLARYCRSGQAGGIVVYRRCR